MHLIEAKSEHIPIIQAVSSVAWPHTFKDLLSSEQIKYMMDMMYSTLSLEDQIGKLNHHYLIVEEDGKHHAYTSYETDYEGKAQTKIHKIYLLPSIQKKGIGRYLIDTVIDMAKKANQKSVLLNVNKYNENAIGFYRRMGFEIVKSEENDIGNGFVMDDYVLSISI